MGTQSEDNMIPQKKIPLMEIFGPTVQGEGAQVGYQTYFLRFGLCDYRCAMCDSMHAVDPRSVKANAMMLTQDEIAAALWKHIDDKPGPSWVTFSGGNPCIHGLMRLVDLLQYQGMKINVETQGTLSPMWVNEVDYLTISPKGPGMGEVTNIKVLRDFVQATSSMMKKRCMKIVVFDQRDLDFAKEIFREFENVFAADEWFLSLGNTYPPGLDDGITNDELVKGLLSSFRVLYEDIQHDPILSKFRFLPQLHTLIWANKMGV